MSRIKLTTESFIQKAKELYGDRYDYSQVDYKGVDNNVNIICPKHGLFVKRAREFLKGRYCNKCTEDERLELALQEFLVKAKTVHGDKYDYSQVIYINNDTNVEIICPVHGSFYQSPHGHLAGHNCPSCALITKNLKISNTLKSKIKFKIRNSTEIISIIEARHPNVEVIKIDDETNIVTAKCIKHDEFQTKLRNARKIGTQICKKCDTEIRIKVKNLLEVFTNQFSNKYDYSNCSTILVNRNLNVHTKIKIICPDHGLFMKSINEHQRGQGCPKCIGYGYSKMQIYWLEFIMKRDDIFIQHYENSPQEHLIKNSKFRADGYCNETNTIYEFDGCMYHGCIRCYPDRKKHNPLTNETYGKLHLKTILKRKHILENDYNLVYIWEHDWIKLKKKAQFIQRFFRKHIIKRTKINYKNPNH